MKRVPNISCKCFMLVQFYGGISPPPQPLFWVRHAIHIPLSRYICKISTLFLHLRTPLALIKIQALARPEPSQVIRPSSVVSGVGNRQSSLPPPVVSAMPWAVGEMLFCSSSPSLPPLSPWPGFLLWTPPEPALCIPARRRPLQWGEGRVVSNQLPVRPDSELESF